MWKHGVTYPAFFIFFLLPNDIAFEMHHLLFFWLRRYSCVSGNAISLQRAIIMF